MTPIPPDPRFPDRPTHPDFELLAGLARQLDHGADTGTLSYEQALEKYGIDEGSLHYLAANQARLLASMADTRDWTTIASAISYGVLLGVMFQRERS